MDKHKDAKELGRKAGFYGGLIAFACVISVIVALTAKFIIWLF